MDSNTGRLKVLTIQSLKYTQYITEMNAFAVDENFKRP